MIAGSDENLGWQHDGSTTAGTWNDGDGDKTYSTSSDGDNLTMSITFSGSSGGAYNGIYVDSTATRSEIERDYYPFIRARFRLTVTGDISATANFRNDGYYTTFDHDNATWTTQTINFKTEDSTAADDHGFYMWAGGGSDGVATFEVAFVKAYSIANYTLSQSGTAVTDYLYVSSSVLYASMTSGTIELNHDPALSVSDTYSVWNLTTAGTSPEFSQYVSSWSSYSSETRGATTTGTVTDVKIRFDGTESLSAITFIEDATAPDADVVANPTDPYDDEAVTLSSIVFDSVEVYKVWYDAISYPDGFSDVDYEATEGQENYWSYTFAAGSLPAGDYAFKVIANDGANNNTITASNRDYATVRFTVRESEITVQTVTLFGANPDLDYMEWSFELNKDCSYAIREWSENVEASTTHSGTVAAGVPNIAWDKLSTSDSKVNFTVTLTNASLSFQFNSSYQVAQSSLAITERLLSLSESTVTFSAENNKDSVTYTVYLDGVQEETGTINSGSFYLDWTRPSSTEPSEIAYALKFTDGITTVWVNNTYDEYTATSFSIETLMTDSTGNEISVFVDTTWDNATVYLYQDDILQTSGAEGSTLSYSKATADGDYSVGVKIDAGGVVKWTNFTYSITAGDSLQASVTFESSGGEISVFVSTNWANTTVYLYQNDSLQTSGSEGSLSYAKATAAAEYSVGVYIDGTADAKWANFSYTVSSTSFAIQSLYFVIADYVTAKATTNWANATLYLYEDDVLQTSGAESTTISYAKATIAGTYSVALKLDAGADSVWINDTYTVAVLEILLSNAFYGEGESSWRYTAEVNQAVNYYVFDNDTLVQSGSKSTGFFSISADYIYTIGKHIVKIKFNTTGDTEWAGGSYDITTTLDITSIDTDQDNVTCSVGFELIAIDGTTLSYTVWEVLANETKIAEGTRTVVAGNFISIGFEKSSANVEANATIVLSDGTSTVNITVIYIIVEPKTVQNTYGGGIIDYGDTYYYEITQRITIADWNIYTTDYEVFLTGRTNHEARYVIYQGGVQVEEGAVGTGTFKLSWSKDLWFNNINVTAVFTSERDSTKAIVSDTYSSAWYSSPNVAATIVISFPIAAIFLALAAKYWRDNAIVDLRGKLA